MTFQKNYKIKPVMLLFALAAFVLTSCGGDDVEEAKSMQQIQIEEGIPVVVKKVEHTTFRQYVGFYSKLSGIKEATEGAAVGGRIEKINVNVGDVVKKGDVIMEFPKDAIAIQYEQAKTAFYNAEKNYKRMEALLKAGETSQANYDGVETQYLVVKRNYETQKQMMFVEAPFDGIVTAISVKEGDNVKGKAALFSIAQLNKIRTRVWASEEEIKTINTGMPAYLEYDGKKYKGKVTETAMAMTPWRQAYYVDVEFPNPSLEIKSGPTVKIEIMVYENKEAVVVPRNLVKEDGDGRYVCVVNNGQAQKRYITNGRSNGLDYQISSGLNIGDNLIIKGSAQLSNGTKVKVID